MNPFHTWNRVFLPYCDGSVHVGSRLSPVEYKNTSLYFRGSNNTLAHFAFLNDKYSLFSATNITITGTSAGGVASFLWSNFVYEQAVNKEGVLVVPDSGTMILDFPNLYNNKTLVDYTIETYKLVLAETTIPLTECAKKYPSQVECFQSGNLYEFIKPRLFVLQSQYDSWGLIQVLQFRCIPNVNPSNLTKCNDTERAYI
jgi:O-palmitoleoyl-L-serine hydrolase